MIVNNRPDTLDEYLRQLTVSVKQYQWSWAMQAELRAIALAGMPLFARGMDVAAQVAEAAARQGEALGRSDSLEDVGGGWWLPRDLLAVGPTASTAGSSRPQ